MIANNRLLQSFPIQGFGELPNGGIELISDVIRHNLGIEMTVLMGANLANEVAEGHFCETTIGECWGYRCYCCCTVLMTTSLCRQQERPEWCHPQDALPD